MIHAVRANQPSFRAVEFQPGLNVVLADSTDTSHDKDSRNGLGKSTLIEILHFCFGARTRPRKGLRVPSLDEWAFTTEFTVAGHRLAATRSAARPGIITVDGDLAGLPLAPETIDGRATYSANDWCALLGRLMFDCPAADDDLVYNPSFRSLISYVIRRGNDAFTTPFEHHRKQLAWDLQLHNAYLLGLDWEHAAEWQRLKDGRRALNELKKAARAGLVDGLLGSRGELEAERVRLSARVEGLAAELAEFRVHPEYARLETRASELTRELHELNNANVADREVIGFYRDSLTDTTAAAAVDVDTLYREAGVVLPDQVRRRLDEVEQFHRTVIRNRRDYLESEMGRLEAAVAGRTERVRGLDEERSRVLAILAEHGALEEYTLLQTRHSELSGQVRDINARIRNLDRIDDVRGTLGVEQTQLYQRARLDYDARQTTRAEAIRRFNAHSEALYEAPGRLHIDLNSKTGYRFGVEIDGGGSEGIERMKVFCYDLMLAELLSGRSRSPGFLVHDSTLFSGVDERQRGKAIERAAACSDAAGFQYICLLNSDQVPAHIFSPGFSLEPYTRLRLTDDSPDGSLLGFRVPPDEPPLTR